MKEKLVIWGASSHALVVAETVRTAGNYEIVGFLDGVNPERCGQEFCGARILGGHQQLDELVQRGVRHVIFGIGNNLARLKLTEIVRAKDCQLAIAIHPRATVASDANIGPGTVIGPGAIINPHVRLGENVVLNTSATVGHECIIGDGVLVNAGVNLAGKVEIGRAATIEIGAVIGRGLRIGAGTVVGAGSVVLHDMPDGVLAYGAPAKVIREIAPHD